MMATICRGGKRQITKNFVEAEFHSQSVDAPKCHTLDDKVINGIQIIRDWFGAPIRITSTLRTSTGNALVDGKSNSRHLEPARAIDSQFIKNRDVYLQKFYDDFKCKGPLYRKLRANGINGIGIYDSFIHIDTRSTPSFWDNSAGKWGDVKVDNSYMSKIPESGLSGSQCEFQSESANSDYGLTGFLAPLDPSNYSGEDGIKSQERGIKRLLFLGLFLSIGGIGLLYYARKSRFIPTDFID